MARFSNYYGNIVFCGVIFALLLQDSKSILIEDFRTSDTSGWKELSDSLYHNGHSISSFVSHSFKEGQKALLFTLLVPCEKNASVAGIIKHVSLDISNTQNVVLKIRGQGEYNGYEFVLRHNGDFGDSVPSYVTYFEAPAGDFLEVVLPIDEFKAYHQGQPAINAPPLNKENITALAILAYGGIHRNEKQKGVAVLEIETISVE